jgi:hypothetical protein
VRRLWPFEAVGEWGLWGFFMVVFVYGDVAVRLQRGLDVGYKRHANPITDMLYKREETSACS